MNVWQSRQEDRLLLERGGQLEPAQLSRDPAGASGCFCSHSGEAQQNRFRGACRSLPEAGLVLLLLI